MTPTRARDASPRGQAVASSGALGLPFESRIAAPLDGLSDLRWVDRQPGIDARHPFNKGGRVETGSWPEFRGSKRRMDALA